MVRRGLYEDDGEVGMLTNRSQETLEELTEHPLEPSKGVQLAAASCLTAGPRTKRG